MDTRKIIFATTIEKPSSDVFAEIVGTLAATYIVFKRFDHTYSATLHTRAKIVGEINFIVLTNP